MKQDIGLLILRVTSGAMMLFGHGWSKMANFEMMSGKFPSIFGMGSTLSLSMAILTEVGCALALILGLGTRISAAGLFITMMVAALIVHADDPWGKKEFALLYAIPFLTLIFTGAGKFGLDNIVVKFKSQK